MIQQLDSDRREALANFFALIGAAMYGLSDVMGQMLDKGVEVNARAIDMGLESINRDVEKATIGMSDTPLLVAVKHTGNVEIIRLLLNRGADVNAQDEEGNTAIAIATERGRLDIVKILKTAGAH